MLTPHFLLKVHAGFLIVLTLALSGGAFLGVYGGAGPFAWTAEAQIAVPGLMQAYFLMLLVGIVMWVGAKAGDTRPFHWLGIGAHLVPLSLLPVFWGILAPYGATETAPASFVIHGGWIAVEASSLWRLRQSPAQAAG